MKEFSFELTLKWPSTKSVTVRKTFKAASLNRAWGAAKRWQSNCVAICGKNEVGEASEDYELRWLKPLDT